jgi:hypothetical protein
VLLRSGGNLHESSKHSADSSFGFRVEGLRFKRSSKQTLRGAPAPTSEPLWKGREPSEAQPNAAANGASASLPSHTSPGTCGGNPECVMKREASGL